MPPQLDTCTSCHDVEPCIHVDDQPVCAECLLGTLAGHGLTPREMARVYLLNWLTVPTACQLAQWSHEPRAEMLPVIQVFKQAHQDALRRATHSPCPEPGCQNTVDLLMAHSGACSPAHGWYFCEMCLAPHRYVSERGQEHLAYRRPRS